MENLNRGFFNNLETLKEKAIEIKEAEEVKETPEERRIRLKQKGDFDVDTDEEEKEAEEEKRRRRARGEINYFDEGGADTKGTKMLKTLFQRTSFLLERQNSA